MIGFHLTFFVLMGISSHSVVASELLDYWRRMRNDNQNHTPGNDDTQWRFQPVTSIQVRVQGNLPAWDPEKRAFTSTFGTNSDERYRAVLDSVNMAGVEGALKYIQGECINKNDPNAVRDCKRRNNIQYIVFYQTKMVQPVAAMAKYHETASTAAMEHCPFAAMDGGTCQPSEGFVCQSYAGVNNQEKVGFCVGGELRENDPVAPYPDTYWFSYPSSCPTRPWALKTDQCRQQEVGGLCPFGVEPDGEKCSFSYEILGYVKLDDLVGITEMKSKRTGQKYKNYNEFCLDGGIEFQAYMDHGKKELVVQNATHFWQNAGNRDENRKRVDKLLKLYEKTVKDNPKTPDGGTMKPLPSIKDLTSKNPACFHNNERCATAEFGCRRKLYAQVCEVCTKKDPDCVKRPDGFKFPDLKKIRDIIKRIT